MFRRDKNYQQIDQELAGRAFASLYALHSMLSAKEARAEKRKSKKK
jgi:hypothetical protein